MTTFEESIDLMIKDGYNVTITCYCIIWSLNGKKHRVNGPTIINVDGSNEWFPLNGFMTEKEYYNVLENMELLDGSLFTLPINLPITTSEYENIKDNKYITLKDELPFIKRFQ